MPDPPPSAQDPNAIPDAATQLADGEYQVAHAEQETGKSVDAVITPPYTVSTTGVPQPTPLSVTSADTISVSSRSAAKAVVLPVAENLEKRDAPDPVPAWYMTANNLSELKADAAGDACTFANRQTNRQRALLLDFGAAKKSSDGSFGAELRNLLPSLETSITSQTTRSSKR